jgi:hypothetical protein
MKSHRFLATLVLVVLAAAPLAFAQGTKPKKKPAKGAPSASASAPALDLAQPTPPPAPAPEAEPSASASAAPADLPATPPDNAGKDTDTNEEAGKRYYFVGLRYRGNLVPQFLENLFVDDGSTVFSNSVGLELDMRTDGHSTMPWIQYSNYGFGDTLFLQKGKPDVPENYSDVKSSLSAIYLGLDELWSTPLDEAHHWDFEYGFGVGIGFLFGTLNNDWVYEDNKNGALAGTNGNHYSQCPGPGNTLPAGIQAQPGAANPCDPGAHQNSQDTKTGGYQEKTWFGGGSVPVIFPHIALPILSVRYKPVKQFEARLGLGFSLTGFWFGLSGDYGLEKPEPAGETAPKPSKSSGDPTLHKVF